jgi:hypothetical protein
MRMANDRSYGAMYMNAPIVNIEHTGKIIPCAVLSANEKYSVFIYMPPTGSNEESDIRYVGINDDYENMCCPVVNIKTRADMSWLLGMKFGDMHVSYAVEESHFQMDENGACAKSAGAVEVETTSAGGPPSKVRPRFAVNRPFAFRIVANDIVIFKGTVSDDAWSP